MTFINYAAREINCKIVYYGPGLCGKTTNLQYIYDRTNPSAKGKLISLATETDRTLFFDFLPLYLGTVKGFKTRVLKFSEEDRILWVLPLAYHFAVTITAYVRAGSHILLCPDTLPKAIVDATRRLRASVLYAAPLHFERMANLGPSDRLSNIRVTVSTAALPGCSSSPPQRRRNASCRRSSRSFGHRAS